MVLVVINLDIVSNIHFYYHKFVLNFYYVVFYFLKINYSLVHLFYYEDYSVREIADILKLSESNAKVRLTRGRTLLRNVLKEEWDDDK